MLLGLSLQLSVVAVAYYRFVENFSPTMSQTPVHPLRLSVIYLHGPVSSNCKRLRQKPRLLGVFAALCLSTDVKENV